MSKLAKIVAFCSYKN